MKISEHQFTSHDGTSLFYRVWLPESGRQPSRALILLHRGHEHSGRWAEMVDKLALPDTAIFAWDQRGHGQSPGPRGGAENLGVVIRDLEAFARHIEADYRIRPEDTVLLAHSVGAVIAAAWVHDYAPRLRGMILGTPAFEVKLYVPLAVPMLRLKQKLLGPGEVKSYVKSAMLTHDKEQAKAYAADPAIFRQIAVNILLDLNDTAKRVVADAAAIRVPTLLMAADQDWVVRVGPQRAFVDRLGSAVKEFHMLHGFHHAIFHEAKRDQVFQKVREFFLRLFDSPPVTMAPLVNADRDGWTKSERDELERTRSHPFAAIQRTAMRTLGRMSAGIDLGWRSGFDSGETLDYVYRNHPQGVSPVGRLMDRSYLESPGWTGIRWRGAMLQRMISDTIARVAENNGAVRLVDIACGGGRYDLQALAADPQVEATAVLRDYKQANLDVASGLARELGLEGRVRFEKADAFDRESLAGIEPPPSIAIVSGLYELFPDNEPLRRSLAGLHDALQPGGWLIYTNQPWHPQLKFIAHVLTNREGDPWIMRRRTQEEMDDLVREAGFIKERQETDPNGIFTISIARKQA